MTPGADHLPGLRQVPERFYRDWYSPHVNDPFAEIGVADAVFWASLDSVERVGGEAR